MKIVVERRASSDQETFRLLQWDRTIAEVELVGANKVRRPIQGLGTQLHLHEEAELTLVREGEGRLIVGDFIGHFKGPEFLVLSPHVPHCWHAVGNSAGYAVQFPVDARFTLSHLPECEALTSFLRSAGRGFRLRDDRVGAFASLFERMVNSNQLARLGEFFLLLEMAAEVLPDAEPLSQKLYGGESRSRHFRAIQAAISLITQDFAEDLELSDVVEKVGMSRASFCREFKRFTGRTFVEFVNGVRVDAVCRELLQCDESVAQIAFACGFGNLSNFNRIFRRTKGVSPSTYRKGKGSGDG